MYTICLHVVDFFKETKEFCTAVQCVNENTMNEMKRVAAAKNQC